MEAIYDKPGQLVDHTAAAARSAGEVIQYTDGRPAVAPVDISSGALGALQTSGIHTVDKVSAQVWIAGAPIWWDHSADAATCVPPLVAGDRDFYLGTAVDDVASGTTSGQVHLGVKPEYIIDLMRDGGDTAVVLTAGSPTIFNRGASLTASFSATAEAQKLDWLSKRSFVLGSNWVLEAVVEVVTNADADVGDLNVGVANDTHASDADSITESAFFHFDMGADLNLDVESDDGTTEVAATDSTIDWAVGTPLYLVIDGRNPAALKFYVNGVETGDAQTKDISAATGPLKALFHFEKSSNDSSGVVQLDALRVRTMEQD